MKQISVPMFETSDGETFTDRELAAVHQAELDSTAQVEAYLEAKEVPSRTAASVRKHILGFLAFQMAQDNAAEPAEDMDAAA